MKAWILETPSVGIEALKLHERATAEPGPGQVLVSMKAWSLNYRDLVLAEGAHQGTPDGLIPLSDGAGEIVSVGAGVTRWQVGDRVIGIYSQRWLSGRPNADYPASALGGPIDGVLADYVVFDEDGLVELPPHLSMEEGATLPCAGVTAWNGLVASGGLTAGETVLTMGTGGVSVFALQIAKAAGARVISTSSSDDKLSRLADLGADAGINYAARRDWDREVLLLTNDIGADHVVEVGGAGTLSRSISAVRTGGHIALIGILAADRGFDPTPLIMKNIRLNGIGNVGSREMFEALNAALAASMIRPVIDKVFPFKEADAAFRYFKSRAHFGKVVISA